MANKVVLIGQENAIFKEDIAAGAILPGQVVSLNSSSKLVVRPATVKREAVKIAINNEIFGSDLTVAYAADDTVLYAIGNPGMEFSGLTPSGALSYAVGDLLKVVDGNLVKISAGEEALAVAISLQAITQASGNAVRIKAELL